ncbi:hypothetical protein A2U01_0109859, partial [Trifolium medium]|nr:hypothetical protein [Trifolium medium]
MFSSKKEVVLLKVVIQ